MVTLSPLEPSAWSSMLLATVLGKLCKYYNTILFINNLTDHTQMLLPLGGETAIKPL